MIKIYKAHSDTHEAEGMYTESGALLDFWSCNDAHWRDEYFNEFMSALGIEVRQASSVLNTKFEAFVQKEWG